MDNTQRILQHPHHSPETPPVHVDHYINRYLTVGIVIFIIIVLLFGIYIMYIGA